MLFVRGKRCWGDVAQRNMVKHDSNQVTCNKDTLRLPYDTATTVCNHRHPVQLSFGAARRASLKLCDRRSLVFVLETFPQKCARNKPAPEGLHLGLDAFVQRCIDHSLDVLAHVVLVHHQLRASRSQLTLRVACIARAPTTHASNYLVMQHSADTEHVPIFHGE